QDIFYFESDKSGHIERVESISGSLEDIATGIWLSGNGDLLYTGTFESYKLSIEANEVINASELTIFNHVSGTYYDRRPYSFLARRSGYTGPGGINKYEDERFRVYPNPSSGLIHIEMSPGSGDVLVKVHDINGKRVYEKASGDETIRIDLSDQPQGMYVVSFVEKNRVVNMPVLIIK
ncbi:MAG: T9SS type A sorting domain-containing protein, partial [Bacteroidales bacterium]|nr:T9SS type A sorting domain-containing protein [Bacteroidales bacterium]